LVEEDWFEVRRFPRGITMIGEPHHREDVKSYLVEGERDVAVIDTGMGVGDFPGLVARLSSRRPRVFQTHAHWDHIGASHRFAEVLVHPAEADGLRAGYPPARFAAAFTAPAVDPARLPADFDPAAGIPGREPTGWLAHGDRLDLGGRELEVFHTPGHSPGGVTFLDRQGRALFPGDLLYLGRMFVFFPGQSDPAAFRESLRLAAELAELVDAVYPAHDASPIAPGDVRAIHEAYETVWAGRAPDRVDTVYGQRTATHDFGRFSFHLPPGWAAVRRCRWPSGAQVRNLGHWLHGGADPHPLTPSPVGAGRGELPRCVLAVIAPTT
jgi:glyoxylase-like metal-dependent hydrolase (beta-lactamase superfamily II)